MDIKKALFDSLKGERRASSLGMHVPLVMGTPRCLTVHLLEPVLSNSHSSRSAQIMASMASKMEFWLSGSLAKLSPA